MPLESHALFGLSVAGARDCRNWSSGDGRLGCAVGGAIFQSLSNPFVSGKKIILDRNAFGSVSALSASWRWIGRSFLSSFQEAERFGSGDGEQKASMTRQMPYEPLPASVLSGVFMDSEQTPSNKGTYDADDKGRNDPKQPEPIERLDDVIDEREIAVNEHRSNGARQDADEENENRKKSSEERITGATWPPTRGGPPAKSEHTTKSNRRLDRVGKCQSRAIVDARNENANADKQRN